MKDFYSNYVIPANIQFARIDPEYKNRIYHYFCGSPIHSQRRYIKALVYNEVVALYLSGNIDEASKIACRLESFHTFYWEDHELERIEKVVFSNAERRTYINSMAGNAILNNYCLK